MRKLVLTALAAGLIAPASGQAFDVCRLPLADASAENPHSTDYENDRDSLVDGRGPAGSAWAGDLYREAVDITATWLDYNDAGTVRANIQVMDLGEGIWPNATYYILWTYGTGPDSQRWASARLKGYDVAYAYGYQTVNSVTGNPQFATVGETTGAVDAGADTVSVDLPADTAWGSPESGSEIIGIVGESRVLVGSPEPLPTNPTGLRHGFVYVADTSDEICLGTA